MAFTWKVTLALAGLLQAFACGAREQVRQAGIEAAVQAACGARVVLLGELPSHGEALAFDAKARIGRLLVERCGFDTVLFEAPRYEFDLLRQPAAAPMTQAEFDAAIGPFWNAVELAPWRAWLRERALAGTLYVGGLDDSAGATSALTRQRLPDALARAIPTARRADCRAAFHRNLHWEYDAASPFDAAERARLHDCARAARDGLAGGDAPARDAAEAFLRYSGREAGRPDAMTRDASLHASLLSQLGPARRAVVWTATVHAAREAGGRPYVPLGAMLSASMPADIHAIGFTALQGRSSMAGQPVRELEAMPGDSFEAEALRPDADLAVVGGDALRALDGRASRLFGAVSRHAWSRQFDTVLVFRTERAPTFPPR